MIGLGSIGKRHLKNILLLGYSDVSVVSGKNVLPPEFSSCILFVTIEDAVSKTNFDAAIICVPTAFHIVSLRTILNAGIKNIFLEKPVSHNYKDVEEINKLIIQQKARVVVGFDMHYDLGLLKVKELISSNVIGTIVSANAEVGQYLPDWRPNEDYSSGMSAKKETGGGVLLDLVHEFDYLIWLLGDVKTIASFNKNSGSLKIETEDVAEVLLKFDNNVIGTIHLDYLQQKLVRNCLITGSDGTIFWDLTSSKVKWILKNKSEHEFSYEGFERNDRFINIIKDFLENKSNEQITLFDQGLQSLKLILAAKHSSNKNVFVEMETFNPIV